MKSFNDIPEIAARTYLENDLAYTCLTYIPITPGHSLIIPRRTVDRFELLTPEELAAIHALTAETTWRLQDILGAEGFNFAWNQGADYGQSIPHFHLHVVPRTPEDAGVVGYEPREFLYRPGSREPSPEHELAALASQLRS
jgi:diadenosine tetraphosphate (Ap4A) HIT family hydrolase